ncbi:MAG: hypothetical protein ABW000_21480 [Actinoplanes sp.]
MAESEGVASSTIAVHRCAWAPTLPAELAAMVAPPVSVSSLPVAEPAPPAEVRRAKQAKLRGNMPSVPQYSRPRRTG